MNGVNAASMKLQIRFPESLAAKGTSLFLSCLTSVYCCSQPSEGYLRYCLQYWVRRRHPKFRGNQSGFVFPHKACLGVYGNLTMMLSVFSKMCPSPHPLTSTDKGTFFHFWLYVCKKNTHTHTHAHTNKRQNATQPRASGVNTTRCVWLLISSDPSRFSWSTSTMWLGCWITAHSIYFTCLTPSHRVGNEPTSYRSSLSSNLYTIERILFRRKVEFVKKRKKKREKCFAMALTWLSTVETKLCIHTFNLEPFL